MFKPLHDYLIIKPDFSSAAHSSIVSIKQAKPTRGKVVAIGPGKQDEVKMPATVKVGSTVAFSEGSLDPQIYRHDDGEKYVVFFLKAEHIIGVEPEVL